MIETTVTDAKKNATFYWVDGFGRPVLSTNAKGETTQTSWDGHYKVIELVEEKGAVTSWTYDQNTDYPTLIRDAEANSTLARCWSMPSPWMGTWRIWWRTSPEARRWEFGYDSNANPTSVTDAASTATTDVAHDYTTYACNGNGMLATVASRRLAEGCVAEGGLPGGGELPGSIRRRCGIGSAGIWTRGHLRRRPVRRVSHGGRGRPAAAGQRQAAADEWILARPGASDSDFLLYSVRLRADQGSQIMMCTNYARMLKGAEDLVR